MLFNNIFGIIKKSSKTKSYSHFKILDGLEVAKFHDLTASITRGHKNPIFWILQFLPYPGRCTKFHKIRKRSLPGGGCYHAELLYYAAI
jgi:hypothetical protein